MGGRGGVTVVRCDEEMRDFNERFHIDERTRLSLWPSKHTEEILLIGAKEFKLYCKFGSNCVYRISGERPDPLMTILSCLSE